MTEQTDEAAWEQAADGLDLNVVRALRSEGVRVEHLTRAARFIEPMASEGVETLKRQAQYLREDIPALFGAASAAAAAANGGGGGGGGQKTAVERGRALAVELGWAKSK